RRIRIRAEKFYIPRILQHQVPKICFLSFKPKIDKDKSFNFQKILPSKPKNLLTEYLQLSESNSTSTSTHGISDFENAFSLSFLRDDIAK
ncbi:36615_t:CDS:2, partial [Gigaspora margarita]